MRNLSNKKLWFFLFGGAIYFAILWNQAIFFDSQGNLVLGNANMWGDWAAHFMIASAIWQRGIFITSPFLLNAKFSYPFANDFISALLLQAGFSWRWAFLLPSFLLSLFFFWGITFFYRQLFKSINVAVAATVIFLGNGGTGFLVFLRSLFTSDQPLQLLVNPPHEYTHLEKLGIKWISIIDSMVLPQRAFLLGFAWAIFLLALIYRYQAQVTSFRRQIFLFAAFGIGLGFLPIMHVHSFLACFLILGIWAISDLFRHQQRLKQNLMKWGILVTATILTAWPLLDQYIVSSNQAHFLQWYPGWLANDFHLSWLDFWWRNWGVTPILAFLGWLTLWRVPKQRPLAISLLPFWLIFSLINLFLFQPFAWDNTKLLVWVNLGFALLAAILLRFLWQRNHVLKTQFRFALRGLAIGLFSLMIFSGGIDAYRLLRLPLHTYVMYTKEELQMAEWVKKNTPVTARWLTSDQHNHWLSNLTGRQILMAYRGWLWTYGLNYLALETVIKTMYAGGESATKLLEFYQVKYVVIGPSEQENFAANEAYFNQHFPLIYQSSRTKIYQIY